MTRQHLESVLAGLGPVAVAVSGGVDSLTLATLAHRLAPASTLAPFIYTQMIWMTLFGYLIFGDVPDKFTIIGGLIVVGSGLYLLMRERRQQEHAATPQIEAP